MSNTLMFWLATMGCTVPSRKPPSLSSPFTFTDTDSHPPLQQPPRRRHHHCNLFLPSTHSMCVWEREREGSGERSPGLVEALIPEPGRHFNIEGVKAPPGPHSFSHRRRSGDGSGRKLLQILFLCGVCWFDLKFCGWVAGGGSLNSGLRVNSFGIKL